MNNEKLKEFIYNCHMMYDTIHGKEQIIKIFNSIKKNQLIILINIYQTSDIHLRWHNIYKYIENTDNLSNKEATSFLINAIQH